MTDNTLKQKLMALDKLRQTHQIDNPEYFDRLEGLIQDAVNEATVRPVADLAECLGVLRGLGHPNETLEAKYDLTKGETDANR